ncbi:MAG: response regulator [Methanobacterium sp.]|jgi:chemotaxis family two-component system response regulator Rcp1
MSHKPNILIVEDNPGDARLISEILNEADISHQLYLAKDGEMALQMLRRKGEYSDFPIADLILLDMNLPKRDGKDVLKDIKLDNELNNIPIIILTTLLPDIGNNHYAKLVDAVLIKSSDLEGFEKIAKCIKQILNK